MATLRGKRWRSMRARWCTIFLGAMGVSGEIFPYDGMALENEHVIYRESGMFVSKGMFTQMGGGNEKGDSFIKLGELKFELEDDGACGDGGSDCPEDSAFIEIAVFEQKGFASLGVAVDKTRFYCCDSQAISNGACSRSKKGQLLVSDKSEINWTRHVPLSPRKQGSLDATDLYRIPETGMYVVLMANCNPSTGTVRIKGHSEWMNPYGYLPGEKYGYLPFFFIMSMLYLGLGVLWIALCTAYIKDLLAIQMWASLVLLLGMVETGAQYFDYRDWNISGTRSAGVQAFGILFGSAKRALSLSLVLMVCMGYGVVRPSLGRDVHRIMGLALLYFVSSALWTAIRDAGGRDKEITSAATLNAAAFLVLLNSVIDVAFFIWILKSIIGVIEHLRTRRQTVKLNLYLQFRMVLVASVIFGVAWAFYGTIQSSGDVTVRKWQSHWTIDALWEVLYLAILLSVCFLLRPSLNGQRFSSSSFVESRNDVLENGDDDRGILLQKLSNDDAEYGNFNEGNDDSDEFLPGNRKQFARKEAAD